METVADTYAGYSPDWWTPPRWLKWVRSTIGTYIDPCPMNWYPGMDSGLDVDWREGPPYCNHPGGRGAARAWWARFNEVAGPRIWCAFNIEQLRYLRPSQLECDGWLVMPRKRLKFIWGGPSGNGRVHGEPCGSPSNWTVFWSSVEPAEPPDECMIMETGGNSWGR